MTPYFYKVDRVLRVIDGDTIDVSLNLGFNITIQQRVRLIGIDTPELRDKNPHIREDAHVARLFVEKKLAEAEEIIIHTLKPDSFGRCLGEVFLDGVSLNQTLLEEGYAEEYRR